MPSAVGNQGAPSPADRIGQAIQQTCGSCRTGARKELDDAEAGHPITQVLRPAQKREDIFNMCGLEKLEL